MSTKKISDYTDRELFEKSTLFAKMTAENTTFIKNCVIAMLVLSIIGAVIIVVQIG